MSKQNPRFLITINENLLNDIKIIADKKNMSISRLICSYAEDGVKKDKRQLSKESH